MSDQNLIVTLPINVEIAIESIRQLALKMHTWSTGMEGSAWALFSKLSPAQMNAINEACPQTLEDLNDPMGKIFEKRMKERTDEIKKFFDSAPTSDAEAFVRDFCLRMIKSFDDFITKSAESVCRQLTEQPKLLHAESKENQILLQIGFRGKRPIAQSLTRELAVSVQSCGMTFFGPATLDKLFLLNFALDSPGSIIRVELPTSAAFSLQQGRSVSVEVVLSGEHIPGSPFILYARRGEDPTIETDSRSLWTVVGEGNAPTNSQNYSRLDESDMRVLNESILPSSLDDADGDKRSDVLNRSAHNRSRSCQSRMGNKLPTVQEVSIENNSSGSSTKNGLDSDGSRGVAGAVELFQAEKFPSNYFARPVTRPDASLDETLGDLIYLVIDFPDLDTTEMDLSMLNLNSSIFHRTWGPENDEENPAMNAERLATITQAKQAAREAKALEKAVEASDPQVVKNMQDPINNGLAGPSSTFGTPKSLRARLGSPLKEPPQLPSPIAANSRRVFLDKTLSESMAVPPHSEPPKGFKPNVSSTMDLTEFLKQRSINMGPELVSTTEEEEASAEGTNEPESGLASNPLRIKDVKQLT